MPDVPTARSRAAFPIVGVGASSGGLEAFTQLLRHLPADTGLAFVLIQHLDPTRPSLLSEALAKATTMPVRQAEHGVRVEPSHVYVIAPNTEIAIDHGQLVLSPRRSEGPKSHLPVDFFLRSLAAELGGRAIGVILSGTASDGTEGLRAIRAEDGITFAQDPRTAKFPGMPQSAIDAGMVDYCMDIPELAEELVRLSRHPRVQLRTQPAHDSDEGVLEAIFAHVRSAVGVDFGEFKPSTVSRRLSRRLALRGVVGLRAYLALLEAEPDEARALYEGMLIHVTAFFRDPEVFESLRTNVFPHLLKSKSDGGTVRIWVAGCSTGEEVYSLAIAWLEFVGEAALAPSLLIFGSDASELAIQQARTGVYNEQAMRGVSEERRLHYFDRVDGSHRIDKRVRDLCVFVSHDLVRDPPFSKLDLISCRNVLIYFDQALQKKILPTLHYCLGQPGFLLLGHSENISGFNHLFAVADKANRIFLRTATASSLRFAPRGDVPPPAGRPADREPAPFPEHSGVVAKHLDHLLLARYCPPGVLVNERMEVVLFRGQTGAYLQAAPGQPQNGLISMARGGLVDALRTTLARAKRDMVTVSCPGVEVDQGGASRTCDVVVVPFSGLPQDKESLFIVLFEEPGQSAAREPSVALVPEVAPSGTERGRSARLEHELASTKEYLHTLIEEHGRASDELGTSNEELSSGNEELQSMNEELETAKEELQSINEELTTLNDELKSRNQEVTQVNGDLVNFALAVDIAILTLDPERRIRRFTPKAGSLLNIRPADVGRSLDDLKPNVELPDLKQFIAAVIATSVMMEMEVKDRSGRWYRLQIRPYTTIDNAVDGVILSLVDVHGLKQLVAEAENARGEAERANHAKDDFLATLSHELRTPLSTMLLNAQRLRRGDLIERAELQRVGEVLERAARTQMRLIEDLLDVSSIVGGKLALNRRPLDLCALVRAVLDGIGPRIEAKGLVLHVSLASAIEPIWADCLRVQEVVSNLLDNAIKFTPPGGQLTVAVEAAAGFARLRVQDTGIGIEPSFLPRVFERFSQSDSSITRTHGGLGLGLALVRHLAELQGGTVSAASEGVGHGATFSVTFPLAGPFAAAVAAPAGATRPPEVVVERSDIPKCQGALADVRVLVVDDDRPTREAVRDVLQLAGACVELAASAAEGMNALDAFKPQVLLCDIAMPGEDGYAFIRKIRAQASERWATIPALALTALAATGDRQRALAAGFQLHLAKPIDIDRLRDAVLELSKLARSLSGTTSTSPPAT